MRHDVEIEMTSLQKLGDFMETSSASWKYVFYSAQLSPAVLKSLFFFNILLDTFQQIHCVWCLSPLYFWLFANLSPHIKQTGKPESLLVEANTSTHTELHSPPRLFFFWMQKSRWATCRRQGETPGCHSITSISKIKGDPFWRKNKHEIKIAVIYFHGRKGLNH